MDNNLKVTLYCKPTKYGEGFIGWIPKLGGAGSQGKTKKELRDNLLDAARAIMHSNKMDVMETLPSFFDGAEILETENLNIAK